MVKNEADVIEAFVRHNLGHLEYLRVVDNDSTDGTFEILLELVDEGLPLTVDRDPRLDHPQSDVMTEMLRNPLPGTDWFFCLDADEFLESPTVPFAQAVAEWSQDRIYLLPWEYFVPTADDDPTITNPIQRIVHRRVAPGDPWQSKVAVPARFLGQPDLRIRHGNHLLEQNNGVTLPARPSESIRLAHFPVRSAAQMASKAIIGSWATNAGTRRTRGQGRHRAPLKQRALTGEELTAAELTQMAHDYGWGDDVAAAAPGGVRELVRKPLASSEIRLSHTPGRSDAAMTAVLAFADAHFERVRRTALDTANLRVAKTRYGVLAYRPDEDTVAHHLSAYGEWLAPEIDVLIPLVSAGDVVVEVGAGIGTHTVPLARRVGELGQLWAFEGDPRLFRLLCTNVTLHGGENVTLELEPPDTVAGPGLDERSLPGLDLLRIADSHLAPAVLAGATALIAEHGPAIYLDDVSVSESVVVLDLLGKFNYRCWWLVNPRFNPENFYEIAEPTESDAGAPRMNLLCLAAGAEQPVGLASTDDPIASWEPAWEVQGRQTYRAPVRWGKPPLGLDDRWK